MRRQAVFAVALLLVTPAVADMYQDGSNAKQPQALDNIGKAAGTWYAPAYGACTWDAAHDVGACVNAALAAAATAGGGTVMLPVGISGVSTPIATTKNNIGIGCNAPSGSKDAYAASAVTGCELKWIGAAGGRMMSFTSVDGTESIVGTRVSDIRFNGNAGLAKDGLYLSGINGGHFQGLRFTGGFSGGVVLSLDVPQSEHSPNPIGSQQNHFSDTAIYNDGYSSTGLYLGFYQSPTGNPANASGNYFTGTQVHSGGKGIWCHGCDLNVFLQTFIATSTEPAVDLDVYVANGHVFGASHNTFYGIGWGNHPGLARGTTSRATCLPMSYPLATTCSWGNAFISIDGQNGSLPPTIETGAFAKYDIDYGVSTNMNSLLQGDGQRPVQTLMSSFGSTNICGTDALAFGANSGSYYCGPNWVTQYFSNGSATVGQQSHYAQSLTGGTPGAEKLQWRRFAGTGLYEFADAPLVVGATTVGALPVCDASRKTGLMTVLDQLTAPTYRGALTGGGTIPVLAYCNGTSWEAH